MSSQKLGSMAFILGVIVAIVAGIFASLASLTADAAGIIILVLVVLGLIVGFLNVGDKEITAFLVASIALVAVGTANVGSLPFGVGDALKNIVSYIADFVAPAALVVALKAVYNLSSQPS